MTMNRILRLVFVAVIGLNANVFSKEPPREWELEGALARALEKNPTILKAREELRRTRGLIIDTRSEALPQLTASSSFTETDPNVIDTFPGSPGPRPNQRRRWNATIEVRQLLYSGGRVGGALRIAKLTDQVAVLDFQRLVADTILHVHRVFYTILLNDAEVAVREQSVHLLEEQLSNTQRRFDVGTVPHFDVLRAQVELANARPPLIRAQNNLRIAKQELARLLALDYPVAEGEIAPLSVRGELVADEEQWSLETAIAEAMAKRPELQQLERLVKIQNEAISVAKSGYKPELSIFGNYSIRNSTFGDKLTDTLDGWTAGAQITWPWFDGLKTHGKIVQARAEFKKAELDLEDQRRAIELEVRQAYSDFLQAQQLVEAQKLTVEQAEESLRLARARFDAGTATQLDVLSAQVALTQARSDRIRALFDYNIAIAALERATGRTVRLP
jgi:outer membrane protein